MRYVDASAWGKLINEEAGSGTLLDHIDELRTADRQFVSSYLLVTELHRSAARLGIPSAEVVAALAEVALRVPDRAIVDLAARLEGTHLRSLDALHVATAIDVRADAFVTYDTRQGDAATRPDCPCSAPTADRAAILEAPTTS